MDAPDGLDAVADDELLYRRIPATPEWVDLARDPKPSRQAFRPNDKDATGLSVYRAKYMTIEEAARGREGKEYYVAVLRAGDLRREGIDVVARPHPGDPGHAELPGLTYEQRKSDEAVQWMHTLAEQLCVQIEGPFST